MTRTTPHVAIIGSGLGGSFLALVLAKKGIHVDIYERFTKSQTTAQNSNRSYSLTLYGYGIKLLKEQGLWKNIVPNLIQLNGSYTQLANNSKPIYTPIKNEKDTYYCISRAQLLRILVEKINTNPRIKMHYGVNIISIDKYNRTMNIENQKTKKISTIKPEVIIGADGANSIVRSYLQQGQESTHSQMYAQWTYKQFPISKKWVATLQLDPKSAYTWSRNNACVAAFPNKDETFSALLILPKGTGGFTTLNSRTAVFKHIENEFPMLLPMALDISNAILHNPEGSYVTIHTNPWYYKDFIAIIGDAAHGFYPFMGQGASAAFGDGILLAKLLETYGPKWGMIFSEYQNTRKKNMDTLGDLSEKELHRYLRNTRADFDTIYNKIESIGHRLLPHFIKAPVSETVQHNPDITANSFILHAKQRKRALFFGIPLSVIIVTQLVKVYEWATHYSDFSKNHYPGI